VCDDERLVGDFGMVVLVGMFVPNKLAHLCVVESFGDADADADGEGWGGWDCCDRFRATLMFFIPRLVESDVLLQLFVFFSS
jgi:hypothetical protein